VSEDKTPVLLNVIPAKARIQSYRSTESQNLRAQKTEVRVTELQRTEDSRLGNWLFAIGYWAFAFCLFEYPITNIQCPIIKY